MASDVEQATKALVQVEEINMKILEIGSRHLSKSTCGCMYESMFLISIFARCDCFQRSCGEVCVSEHLFHCRTTWLIIIVIRAVPGDAEQQA